MFQGAKGSPPRHFTSGPRPWPVIWLAIVADTPQAEALRAVGSLTLAFEALGRNT